MRLSAWTAGLVAGAILSLGSPALAAVVKTVKVGTSQIVLSTKSGQLKAGDNAITVAVTDPKGGAKAATIKKLNLYMPKMADMPAMQADAKLQPARTPGVYTGTLNVEMSGQWIVRVTFKDEKGPHRATFNVVAK